MLSDSESSSQDVQLTINEHFAKAYAAKKEREQLDELKEKYGSDVDEEESEEDSEDAESEDEDGEQLTPAMDAAILRTLAKIKRKDPEIYDRSKDIFEQEQEQVGRTTHRAKPKDTVKPLTMKQHALSSILHPTSRTPSPDPRIVTHDQEQEQLRSEAISAFHHAVDNDKDDDEHLFVLREKTKDELEHEEEEYQEYLKREVGGDITDLITIEDDDSVAINVLHEDEVVPDTMKEKSSQKRKDNSKTDQEFLMNYILNRGWIDRSAKRVPTYKDITKNELSELSNGSHDTVPVERESSLDDEEEFEDMADRFESSYNFRFEEPDAAVIPTHPRNLDSVVRRKDNTRKEARERRKQRKEEERNKKKEEVKLLKALKIKELRRKLEQIGREGGIEIDPEGLVDFDLDGDWDPEKHDRQMLGLYDEEEHEQEDMEKPQWADEINVDDIISTTDGPSDSKSKKRKKKQQLDESTSYGVDIDAMDADVPNTLDEEEWDGTEEMRKRKVQEYMDEVYGMDFNDMVGDIPTRFNYTSVTPQSFALTPSEVLLATDAELNEYMSIKRFAPYRKDSRFDQKRTSRLKELKSILKNRSWVPGQPDTDGVDGVDGKRLKKRKGKKERQRAKALGGEDRGEEETDHHSQPPTKKRRT